jgi:hypothetical protein
VAQDDSPPIEDFVTHDAFFLPLRHLWLSLLNNTTRSQRFPNAEQDYSRHLVTTTSFANEFWPTLSSQLRRSLSQDRAWFGIRSLLQGGQLGESVIRYSEHHFKQLGELEEHPQINRRQTSEFFSDEDLRNLCLINNAYVDWKEKESKYDELDIVRTALLSHAGTQPKESSILVLTAEQKEQMIRLINQGVDQSVQFSNRCKRDLRNQFRDPDFKTKLHSWLTTVKASGIPSRVAPIGHTEYGHTVYRDRMGNPWRIFFSVLEKKGINKGKPFLYIHYICHTDNQQKAVEICGSGGTNLEADEVSIDSWDGRVEHLQHYGDLGDNSLPAPLPDDITEEDSLNSLLSNLGIILDDTQQDALASDRPLLIDGLAGTGKTSVLSHRAGLILKHSPKQSKILVCASGAHVVETLFKGVQNTTSKSTREGKIRVNWQFSGFESNHGTHLPVSLIGEMYPESGFDEIVLDECQDLTHLEFELLTRLAKDRDARRFAIAGDPMQTLNPTGFDWGRIKALFINKNIDKQLVSTSPFHTNYRSQRHIVNLANGIQYHREKVTNVQSVIMAPSLPAGQNRPYLVSIGEAEGDVLDEVLSDAGKGRNNAVLITWASDDQAIKSLLDGEDEVLSNIWNKFVPDDYEDADGFRSVFAVHSTTSIKGSETDSVILYKFLSSADSRKKLASMHTSYEELRGAPSSEKISTAYAFSKLYVAVTRAHQNVFIFEDKEGFDFWENAKLILKDVDGGILQHDFFSPSRNLSEVVMANEDVFNATIEKSRTNFEHHYNRWKETKNINDLHIAINIGNDLLKREGRAQNQDIYFKLEEIKGNLEERKAAEATDETSRNEHLDKALEHYSNARLTERIAPIRFKQNNWEECVDHLVADTPFNAMVLCYCKLKLGLEVEPSDIFRLSEPERAPQHWDLSVSEIMTELKRMAFSAYHETDFSNPNELIYDNRHWFGVSLILEELALSNQPSLLLTRIWEENRFYHEETARLAARSFLQLHPEASESAIGDIQSLIKRYPGLEGELLPALIQKRIAWLQRTEGISNGMDVPDIKIFVDYARDEHQVRAGATDSDLKESVQLKLKTLNQAICLNQELLRSGKPKHDFPRRVNEILDVLYNRDGDITRPSLDDLLGRNAEYDFHEHLEGAYYLFYDLASLLGAPEIDKESRFAWLNNNAYLASIANRLNENFDANRNLQITPQRNDAPGYFYAGSLYFHVKSELGRKYPAYLRNLTALALSGSKVAVQYQAVLKAFVTFITNKLATKEENEPLSEEEFDFILNSVKSIGSLSDFRRLSKRKLNELGFTESQVKLYEFELWKREHSWAWMIDDGEKLPKKPKANEEVAYLGYLDELGLDALKQKYFHLIPIDWGAKFSQICFDIKTYQEFWALMLDYMRQTEGYAKYVDRIEFDQWVNDINALTYGEEELPGDSPDRLRAFQPIANRSSYPGIVASDSVSLDNPLFFLQFTSEIEYLLGYKDQVMNSDGLEFHDIDKILLRVIVEHKVNLLEPQPPQGKLTAAQKMNHQMGLQAHTNFKADVMSLFEGQPLYLEAVALHLVPLTLPMLQDFASKYLPEMEQKATKQAMVRAIVRALGLAETKTAKAHLS